MVSQDRSVYMQFSFRNNTLSWMANPNLITSDLQTDRNSMRRPRGIYSVKGDGFALGSSPPPSVQMDLCLVERNSSRSRLVNGQLVKLQQAGNFFNEFSTGSIFSLPLLQCPNKHDSAECHDSKTQRLIYFIFLIEDNIWQV